MKTFNYTNANEFIGAEFDVYKILVTPEMADEFLSLSIGNRKLDMRNLEALKNDIINGEYNYKTAGSGIAFNPKGEFTNGHHTAKAISETGIATYVQMTLGAESLDKTDSGKTRSLQDTAKMCGYDDDVQMVCKLGANCYRIEKNLPLSNRGVLKSEAAYGKVLNFTNERKDILVSIYKRIVDFKKKNKGSILKKYAKSEPAVIGAIIWNLVNTYGYDIETVYDFVFGSIVIDTHSNRIIDNFRRKVYNDSRKTNKIAGWWSFDDFKNNVENEFMKYVKYISKKVA